MTSLDNGTCHQTWWPAFKPWPSHGARTEQIPTSCPLTYTHMPWHLHTHHTHMCNTFLFFKRCIWRTTRWQWPSNSALVVGADINTKPPPKWKQTPTYTCTAIAALTTVSPNMVHGSQKVEMTSGYQHMRKEDFFKKKVYIVYYIVYKKQNSDT